MKKKIALLVLTMLTLQIFVTGCWDYIEYEQMAQVIGIGVDIDNTTKQLTVSHQYLNPQRSNGAESSGTAPSKIGLAFSATDYSNYGAVATLQQVTLNRMFYGYLKVFILGEEAVQNSLADQIDVLDRTPVIRETAYFLVASGTAEKVLCTVEENSSNPSSQIMCGLLKNAGEIGTAFPVTIHDVAEMLAVGGWEVTIPRVISTAEDSNRTITGGSDDIARIDEKYKGGLKISGMAAFKGDKFAGWLDEKETLGFGWITGKNITAYKVIPDQIGTNQSDMLYFRTSKSGSKIKPELVNNEPVINVDVNVEATLRKYYTNDDSVILEPQAITAIEKELTESIRSDIQAALSQGQTELKSDIFGFGFAFFRKYPKLWNTRYEKIWSDIYPDIPVNVTVKVKVRDTGSNIRRLIVK
ncbi:MAG: Ger(x)C family spore germination protein [Syntrophomonadaceae bacterium]|nr:Ger(x)C family spore germination protein [Syntrophomonadaceae bacterium]